MGFAFVGSITTKIGERESPLCIQKLGVFK